MCANEMSCCSLATNNIFCKGAQVFQLMRVLMYPDTSLSFEGVKELDLTREGVL